MHDAPDAHAIMTEILERAPQLAPYFVDQATGQPAESAAQAVEQACRTILAALYHGPLPPQDAVTLLRETAAHHDALRRRLGREPLFACSLMDHFSLLLHGQLEVACIDAQRLRQLEHNAMIDELTGLYNRRYIMEALEKEYNRVRHTHSPMSILMLDVDHFKRYNDEHGHLEGDLALRQLGDLLPGGCRVMDRVARYGGEEFLILLPETAESTALLVAERLRRDVAGHRFPRGSLTISIGLSASRRDLDPLAMLEHVDRALYRAKHFGRNMICMHDVEQRKSPRFSLNMGARLCLVGRREAAVRGRVRNLSRHGACMLCAREMPLDAVVELSAPTAWSGSRRGRVVRVAGGGARAWRHEVGIHFDSAQGVGHALDAFIASLVRGAGNMQQTSAS